MQTRIAHLFRGLALAAVFGALSISCGGGEDAGGGLEAPTNLKANVLPGPAVHVTWSDVSSGEHHFTIERKDGAGGSFKEIAQELLNITAHHDATVKAGMGITYTYRIAATKQNLEKGPFSAEVSATVP